MSVDRDPNVTRSSADGKRIVTFADVARRTTSRTTDLIAIAIVGIGSLTLGRQVLQWWHVDPPSASATADASHASGWEAAGGPLVLEFGDSPLAMTREALRGDRETAVDALVARCQDEARHCDASVREPGAAERRLIERISSLTPVLDEDGVRQVYVIDERFPMVAAVGRPRATGATIPVHPADVPPRVLCWGLAMPFGSSAWTLYVFRDALARNSGPTVGLEVPLPPGALRNLSLRDPQGGSLVGFSAAEPPKTVMKFYDDWFREQGWPASDGWQSGNRVWTVRYRSHAEPGADQVDVRFAEDRDGRLSGLLQIVPRDVNAQKRGRE